MLIIITSILLFYILYRFEPNNLIGTIYVLVLNLVASTIAEAI